MKKLFLIFILAISGCATCPCQRNANSPVQNAGRPVELRFRLWASASESPFAPLLKSTFEDKRLKIQSVDAIKPAWPDLMGASLVENRSFSTVQLDTSAAASAKNLNVAFRKNVSEKVPLSAESYWLFIYPDGSDANFFTFVHELTHVYFQSYLDTNRVRLGKTYKKLFLQNSPEKTTIAPDVYDYLSEYLARLAEFSVVCDMRASKSAIAEFPKEMEYLNSKSWSEVKNRISDYLVKVYKIPLEVATQWKDSPLIGELADKKSLASNQCPNTEVPSTK